MKKSLITALLVCCGALAVAQVDRQRDAALLTTWYSPHRIKSASKQSFFGGSYWWEISPGAGEKFDRSRKWLTLTISVRTDDSNILTMAGGAAAVITADGAEFDIPAIVMADSMKAPSKDILDFWTVTWVLTGDAAGPFALGNLALDKIERTIARASEVYVTLTGPSRFGIRLRREQIENFRELCKAYDALSSPAAIR